MDLTSAQWRTSSHSGGNGGQCVQVAVISSTAGISGRLYAVQDSRNPAGPVLAFGTGQWRTFTQAIKTGTAAVA